MKQAAKFKKGQKVEVYNAYGKRPVYEVDEVKFGAEAWIYTFLDVHTKKPVFNHSGYSRYWQEERWLRLKE